MYPIDINEHRLFFKYKDKAELIQEKIDSILIISNLKGYKIEIIFAALENGYYIPNYSNPHVMIKVSNASKHFYLIFYIKDYSNEINRLEIGYTNSKGDFRTYNNYQRSIKYILKKVEYLL